jgi:hypothetical protein
MSNRRKGATRMLRRFVAAVMVGVIVFLGITQVYAQSKQKQSQYQGRALSGAVRSISKTVVEVELKISRSLSRIYFFHIANNTKIYGALRKGSLVTVTYTRAYPQRINSQLIALSIDAR